MENAKKKLLSNLKLEEIDQNNRIGSCITKPGNFFAIGLNYIDAYKTIDNLTLHSLHSYFIQPGNPLIPIIFKVENKSL